MTSVHLSQRFEDYLKNSGQNLTFERKIILDTVLELKEFEADKLQDAVGNSGIPISRATIYRTLHLMEEAAVLTRVFTVDKKSVYRLVAKQRCKGVLICSKCGNRKELDEPRMIHMMSFISANHGYSFQEGEYEIKGICSDCRNM